MRWYVYAALAAAAFALLGWSAHSLYKAGYEDAEIRYKAAIATANAKAQEDARKAEQRLADAQNSAAEQYERGKQDAQASADRVVADLRSGNLRLRQQWAAALATSELSRTAASAGFTDGGAALRQRDVGDLRRIIGQCEEHVRALQEVARTDRR